MVGDRVKISIVDEDEKKGILEEIDSRDIEFIRFFIVNVDKVLIVFVIKNFKLNLFFLDRFIVLVEKENLEIVIIFIKVDLDDNDILEIVKNIYEFSGYKVIFVSNIIKLNIDKVKEELKENVVVFVGLFGVGKLSLLNEIDENFKF